MSIFGDKSLEGTEGFEDALKNRIEVQKAAFIRGYRETKEDTRKQFAEGAIINEDIYYDFFRELGDRLLRIKQDDIEAYGLLGGSLAMVDESIRLASAITFSKDGNAQATGRSAVEWLQRIEKRNPEEYEFIRRKLIQRVNQSYGPVAGKDLRLDMLFKPLMRQLAQGSKQVSEFAGGSKPEDLKGFEQILKQKAENERNEFILGYRDEKTRLNAAATPEVFTEYSLMYHLKDVKDLLYGISGTNKEAYTMSRGENVRKYYTLGRVFALVDDVAQRAPAVTFEKGGSASQGGEFAAEELVRIEKEYPVEYAFMRRKLIQRLNKSYRPTMGKNPKIDALFIPIMKRLAQEPKVKA